MKRHRQKPNQAESKSRKLRFQDHIHEVYQFSQKETTTRKRNKGIHRKPVQIFSRPEAERRLQDVFLNHDFKLFDRQQVSLLAHYYQLLMEEQQKQNLTRLLSLTEIAIKHFMDSAMVLQITPLNYPLLDVGTGAGFPGVVLKILKVQEPIILAEGVQKRVAFLKKVREALKLPNLEIVGRKITEEFEYPVAGVITRAVSPMENTLRLVHRCLITQGRVYFMKGPGVDEEWKNLSSWVYEKFIMVQDHPYSLPKTPHQRRLIIWEKK